MTKKMYQKRKERSMINNNAQGGQKTGINWYPGHMEKAKRKIKENLKFVDIVLELIDARVPYSSINNDIFNLINNKSHILIMTKSDLADYDKVQEWVKYYRKKGIIVILVDLKNKKNIKEIYNEIDKITITINKERSVKGLKSRRIRLLVVGIPNVGKSTLINSLVNKKATITGNKPGVTKQINWIRVNDKIELLDTPGILPPRLTDKEVALNLAATTAIKEEVLPLEEVAIHIIKKLQSNYPTALRKRYNIKDDTDIIVILNSIGKLIGAIKNGEVDYDRVYKTIIKDLRDGYLGKIVFDIMDCNE
ncbi:MAG: ribosome biogenesis GTPase YlqF [bacterium]|nr:ribosome biogenesis GTPase YlqF [bacterium]